MTGRLVGQPVPRREDERILRGRTRYLDDIDPPEAVHVAFVRSPFAHARINGIEVPGELEDVFAVVTAADLEGRVGDLPVQGFEGGEVSADGHPVLARDEVRYSGQPIAAVLAGSRAAAEDAAELVEVDYEPLDLVLDARASEVTMSSWHKVSGNVDGAFESAAHVVRASHALPRLAPVPMEPRGAIASYDEADDMLTVRVSAQDSHRQLAGLAKVLDRSEESIHVIVPDVGGAFGSKGAPAPETMLVAAAAMTAGRPVKWTEDREENFVASYQGRGVEADVELALDATGAILALRARIWADLGGYLMPTTAIPAHTTAMLMCGVYDIRAADVELLGRRTTRCPLAPTGVPGGPRPLTSWRARWTWRLASLGWTHLTCGDATSYANSRTRRRSAGPMTPATTFTASTSRRSSSGRSGTPTTHASSAPASGCTSSVPVACSRPPRPSCFRTGSSWCEAARHRTARGTTRRSRSLRPIVWVSGWRTWSSASATRRRSRAA